MKSFVLFVVSLSFGLQVGNLLFAQTPPPDAKRLEEKVKNLQKALDDIEALEKALGIVAPSATKKPRENPYSFLRIPDWDQKYGTKVTRIDIFGLVVIDGKDRFDVELAAHSYQRQSFALIVVFYPCDQKWKQAMEKEYKRVIVNPSK